MQRTPVSIHAPAWGATRHRGGAYRSGQSFNPRARMGRDAPPAPAPRHRQCFNPRARMGRDRPRPVSPGCHGRFQSTRPHGARPAVRPGRRGRDSGFNPRARMGRDQAQLIAALGVELFQSTRPHGARLSFAEQIAFFRQFQSTRPHGARPCHRRPGPPGPRFNPRARMGRDALICGCTWLRRAVSIHAPAWGATVPS